MEQKQMKDLFKFAIKHLENDADVMPELDPERKKFLENVLQSMSVDVKEEFLKALQILDNDASPTEEKYKCLNLIRDYIDDINYANSFVKIGGTDVLIKCTKNTDASVRANAYNVLSELAQNNPYCQNHLHISNFMETLISTLNDRHETVAVLASCLYALSSLVNNFKPATIQFIKNNGIAAVSSCLHTPCSRVFTKACFLISMLSSQFPAAKEDFVKFGTFEMLADNLEVVSDFDIKFEALLIALAALAEQKHASSEYCLSQKIKETLQCSINNIQHLPQCEEMVKCSQTILNTFI